MAIWLLGDMVAVLPGGSGSIPGPQPVYSMDFSYLLGMVNPPDCISAVCAVTTTVTTTEKYFTFIIPIMILLVS